MYDLISGSARKILLGEIKEGLHDLHYGAISIPVQREQFMITESAQNAYCREFKVKKFTDGCADHIRDKLIGFFQKGANSIKTDELVFTTIYEKYIVDIKKA